MKIDWNMKKMNLDHLSNANLVKKDKLEDKAFWINNWCRKILKLSNVPYTGVVWGTLAVVLEMKYCENCHNRIFHLLGNNHCGTGGVEYSKIKP